jgi:hypothetical protein
MSRAMKLVACVAMCATVGRGYSALTNPAHSSAGPQHDFVIGRKIMAHEFTGEQLMRRHDELRVENANLLAKLANIEILLDSDLTFCHDTMGQEALNKLVTAIKKEVLS